ncbi:hypothetical protein HMPREF9412_1622 [Paenibacillus sp. HGF5]|nr:hypothetical protein HMPREF9412_1622 [Paenibacillus sp. HGF5]
MDYQHEDPFVHRMKYPSKKSTSTKLAPLSYSLFELYERHDD